jgi:sRNA-binding regulator protein Hfq
MTNKKDHSVTVYFHNGVNIHGKVISWDDNEAVLVTAHDTSTIVINHPRENILYYKIIGSNKTIDDLKQKTPKNDDDIRAIAELKAEANLVEKEEIAAKLRSHEVGDMKPVQYGQQYSVLAVSRPLEHTREKTPRKNSALGAELQNLFSKEYSKNRTSI